MRPPTVLLAALLAHAARAQAGGATEPAPVPQASTDPGALRLEVGVDGEVAVFRGHDPRPIRGAAIYRAVLRPDLLAAYERARATRLFLLVGAAISAVGGPALGYVLGDAAARPLHLCHNLPPESPDLGRCIAANEQLSAENRRKRRQGLLVGTAVGAGAAIGFGVAGLSVRPHAPDLAEARALVSRYNDSRPKPSGARESRGALFLAPTRGGVSLVLALER